MSSLFLILLMFSPAPSSSQAVGLAAPPLPQRKDSSAQADDIEDVKKVWHGVEYCADRCSSVRWASREPS